MPKATTKIKAPSVTAIRNRDEAEAAIQSIANLQQHIARQNSELTDAVNKLKTEAQQAAAPINEEITGIFRALHVYAEANKSDLLVGKSRTVKLGAGDMGWRRNPAKCTIRGAEGVIEALERMGLKHAIRTKKEIAKDVILNDRKVFQDIKGITINQTEEFFVNPHETKVEQAEVVK